MKKILFLLSGFLLLAFTSLAQVANPILPTHATFSPGNSGDDLGDPTILYTVNDTITVTFDVCPNVPAAVMFAHTHYDGIEPKVYMEYRLFNVEDNTLTIPLSRSFWGCPYDEIYYLHLGVTFAYFTEIDGETVPEYYLDAEGQPVIFEQTYITPDTEAARMEYYYPNQSTFATICTFADAYSKGVMDVYFSKSVTAPEKIASVSYYDADGVLFDQFEASTLWQEWSNGMYCVSFDYSSPDYEASDISKIEIQLNPVQWVNPETQEPELISSPLITLINHDVRRNSSKRKGTTGFGDNLTGQAESATVYDISGRIVRENLPISQINSLAPGIYIANGKKYVVK